MRIATTVEQVRKERSRFSNLGFVPTMGALHRGHLSLIELAKSSGLPVFVSIFVNPLQFNDKNDFDKYPRDLERDISKLGGVDVVFAPESSELLDHRLTTVSVADISTKLEGKFRPGHFDGVATIVSMLFNIIQPTDAWFGEKDFQQVVLIEQMVRDLKFNIRIHRAPIIREESGLALSSRNERLSERGKQDAASISKGLFAMRDAALKGERQVEKLKNVFKELCSLKTEYIEVVDELSLEPVAELNERSRALTAVWCEDVRLIDNVALYA
jgi:pantoate--beta-alanine ligase